LLLSNATDADEEMQSKKLIPCPLHELNTPESPQPLRYNFLYRNARYKGKSMSEDPIEEVLRMMPYGFYSITSKADDDVNAMVANWIIQVSFEPRQLALGIQKTCYTRELIERGGVFAVNLFRKEDVDEVRTLKR
jgi:hypothetical protein